MVSRDHHRHRPTSLMSVCEVIIMVMTSLNYHYRGHLIITPTLAPNKLYIAGSIQDSSFHNFLKFLAQTLNFWWLYEFVVYFRFLLELTNDNSPNYNLYNCFWVRWPWGLKSQIKIDTLRVNSTFLMPNHHWCPYEAPNIFQL